MKERINDINYSALHRRDMVILLSVFFAISLTFFLTLTDYVFSFQKEQFLFIFSSDYLKNFLAQPGGLLEYAGKFLMQFYEKPVAGAIILSSVITLAAYLSYCISDTLRPGSFLAVPISLFSSSLLLLMQSQYYHMMQYNLGFIIVLSLILMTTKQKNNYLPVILFPFIYYITGAFSLFYVAAYCVFAVTTFSGRDKMIKPLLMAAVAALTFFLFKDILFLVPWKALLSYPLPLVNNRFHKIFLVILIIVVILLPLTGKFEFKPRKDLIKKYFSLVSGIMIIVLATYFVLKLYNPMVSDVLKLEKAAYESNWDEIIKLESERQSDNLISQYYYNTALAEKGLLCENLFSINQGSGTKALILPWGDEHLERGALFFYAAGLINEAHRWAYEEMVVYGLRPHNILMLIRTNLLNNNFRMAAKYIDILKKTMFYRDDALHYETLLGKPDKIMADEELGQVEAMLPKKEFFMYLDMPENNLPSLYEANTHNTRAFEYMMAWLLLEKDVETVISNIHLMKPMGYQRLPRHVEEAVMIYYNSQRTMPDLGGLSISSVTLARFDQYINLFVQTRNNNPAKLQEIMRSNFGDTFWYYIHFVQTPEAGKK